VIFIFLAYFWSGYMVVLKLNPKPSMSDPTVLGTVEDVTGTRVSVKLSTDTAHGLLFVRGEGYRVGQVGSFVRIPAGYVDLFGIVAQVGAGAAPISDMAEVSTALPAGEAMPISALGTRWLRIELVGEGRRGEKFERGISQYPSIGDSVHVVTESDLRAVYAPSDRESHVSIGKVASSEGIPAYLEVNRLLSRHCAIVGSTGSGKSNAVASILSAVSDPARFPSARVILLDLHGEYATAFGDKARVFRINADIKKGERELIVPFWALNGEEFISFSMGAVTSTISAPILERIVTLKRVCQPAKKAHTVLPSDVTADMPLPFCINQLWYDLHCLHNATHRVSSNQNQSDATRCFAKAGTPVADQVGDIMKVVRPVFRPLKDVKDDPDKVHKAADADKPKSHIETLETKLRDPRLKFIFQPGDWTPQIDGSTVSDLDSLLEDWLGSDGSVSVFDLSGIPASILEDLVGAMLRILFDSSFWGRHKKEGTRTRPLLTVLEEAHLYLGKDAKNRAASATRRIAKEGRKYGVGLMLVSQRPSEIDPTILSQCGTMVALRLTNDLDRGQIRACTSDNLEGLFGMLPVLRTGEALIIGEAVSMPVRVLISRPPEGRRPQSEDPSVVVPKNSDGKRIKRGGWTEAVKDEDYSQVVEAWRHQNPSAFAPARAEAVAGTIKTSKAKAK
jgi:uncharacterized protein